MRIARLLLGAALLVTAAWPAQASAVTEWRDAGAGVPPSVDLHAVAADVTTVVAVGTDRTTGEAVIYRRAGGAWRRDLPLPPPPPFTPEPVIDPGTGEPVIDPETGEPVMTEPPPPPPKTFGRLVDVAIGGGTPYAVGHDDEDGPLILRLDATGAWTELTAPDAMAAPSTIALSGDDGLLGDAAGQVFELTDGAIATTPLAAGGIVKPPKTPVNGLALTGGAHQAYGIAEPQDPFTGFLAVDGQGGEVRQDVAGRMPAGLELVSVATADGRAVAVDGPGPCRASDPGAAPGLWTRDAQLNLWGREAPAASATNTRWCDVATSTDTLLVAGDRATASGRVGAIWRRKDGGSLRLERDLDARALHGVALGAESWAVGERGALWRHADWPAPPPPQEDGEDADDGSGGDANAAAPPPPAPAPAPAEQRDAVTPAPVTPAAAPETVVASITKSGTVRRARRSTGRRPARRLLVNLEARRSGRRLVLRFRLKARARVLVTALRGAKVVGRTRTKALRPGARRLVIRFRGRRPPTQLKIVVRPAGRPGANKEGKGS